MYSTPGEILVDYLRGKTDYPGPYYFIEETGLPCCIVCRAKEAYSYRLHIAALVKSNPVWDLSATIHTAVDDALHGANTSYEFEPLGDYLIYSATFVFSKRLTNKYLLQRSISDSLLYLKAILYDLESEARTRES